MRYKIVVAPDGFKETLTAEQVCRAIGDGVRRAMPNAQIVLIPLADGGEGTVDALLSDGGKRLRTSVTGPLGDPVSAEFGIMPDGRTAVIEMSSASGFERLAPDRRNPLLTTTFGTGELLLAAQRELESSAAHPARIVLGVGGSATVDAGCGALQALGARFLDCNGIPIVDHLCGGNLNRITRIDASRIHTSVRRIPISLACDVANPLCGPQGAARVFAPQKGADADAVALLEKNLEHIAAIFQQDLSIPVAHRARCGAAGGLPAGLHAALGAELLPGAELVLDALDFPQRIADADLIITGEGRLDATTLQGKVVSRVAEAARNAAVPLIAIVGSVGPGAEPLCRTLAAVRSLTDEHVTPQQARSRPAYFLAEVAERTVRDWLLDCKT